MFTSRNPKRLFDGPLLHRYRKLLGLSRSELARQVGTTKENLSMLERGNSVPSVALLREILKVLDLGMVEGFQLLRMTPPGVSFSEFQKFLAACRQEQTIPAKVLADFIRAYAES